MTLAALPDRRHIPVQDYLVLDAASDTRYEYVNGDIFAITGGSSNHSLIIGNGRYHP